MSIFAKNIYQKILNRNNIEKAYLNLIQQFEEGAKISRYAGLDGTKIKDIAPRANQIIKIAQKELKEKAEISPALCRYIPKKNGSLRDIYIYNIKDRIKAQAIYQIIEPIFEENYSPFLFSYRSSRPSYYAARSVVRRYQRYYGQDYALILDLTNYSNYIDQEILVKKLRAIELPEKIIELLKLFIFNSVYKDEKLFHPPIGVVQGVPLIALFANLYLNDLDHYLGKKVSLYRRIGDDIILMDKNKTKLEEMLQYCQQEIKKLKLKIKKEKSQLISTQKEFNFLGYNFKNKIISLEEGFVKKTISHWRQNLLSHNPKNKYQKIKYLKKILFQREDNINNQFLQIISQKILVNNDQQIKKMSEQFMRIVVKYFFGNYTPRHQRLLQEKLKGIIEIPSLYKYYLDIHHGRKKLANLFISAKSKN
jgi:hypothetical protein